MTAVLSIGSNVGDRLAFLRLAVRVLEPSAVSPVYETEPVGGITQRDFFNAVLLCDLDATQAWQRARQAELRAGRERVVRWSPRTLDVDVVLARPPVPPELVLPHPRAAWRAFVLAPWLDVDPDAELPGAGRVADLLAGLDGPGVRRTQEVLR